MASCNHVVETRTVEKITNSSYPHKGDKCALCNPRGKWNTNQGMAVLVAPELALPGGHPQGHRCHLRRTWSTLRLSQNFFGPFHITCPGLLWLLPWGSWSIQCGTGGGGGHARKAVCCWRESAATVRMYNCPTLLHRYSLPFCPVALFLPPAPSSSILGGRK